MYVLKPRRGARDVMSNYKGSMILDKGEIFYEFNASESASSARLKMGDGHTPYRDLPYGIGYEASQMICSDINIYDSGDTNSTLDNHVKVGKTLAEIIGGLRRSVLSIIDKITEMDNRVTKVENRIKFRIDGDTLYITTTY